METPTFESQPFWPGTRSAFPLLKLPSFLTWIGDLDCLMSGEGLWREKHGGLGPRRKFPFRQNLPGSHNKPCHFGSHRPYAVDCLTTGSLMQDQISADDA